MKRVFTKFSSLHFPLPTNHSPLPTFHFPLSTSPCHRAGFTLLEMLVVIVVMALLMGITFRLMKPSERARQISATVKTLALVNAAITEYQAEYGIYPPVKDPIPWGDMAGGLLVEGDTYSSKSGKCGYVPGLSVAYMGPRKATARNWRAYYKRNPHEGFSKQQFSFGLVSFFIDRRETDFGDGDSFKTLYGGMGSSELKDIFGEESWWFDQGKGISRWGGITSADKLYDALEPSAKDLAFYTRIRSLVKGIIKSDGISSDKGAIGECFYYTLRDSFTANGQDLVYICPPPYTSYALFSAGPDGLVVTDDPLNPAAQCPDCGKYHNEDNVYSSANVK